MTFRLPITFIVFCTFMLLKANGLANAQIDLNDSNHQIASIPSDKLSYLSSKDLELDISRYSKKKPAIVYSNDLMLISFEIAPTSQTINLDLFNHMVDKISYYRIQEGSIIERKEYSRVSNQSSEDNFFELQVNQNPTQIILQIESRILINPIVRYGSSNSFDQFNKTSTFLSGIYTGLMAFASLICLLFFFFTQKKRYFFYGIYFISIFLAQSVLTGISKNLLFQSEGFIQKNEYFIFIPLSFVACYFFVVHFLDLKSTYPKILPIFKGLLVSACLVLCFWPFIHSIIIPIWVELNSSLGAILITFIMIKVLRKSIDNGLYFSIAWGIFILGILIHFSSLTGLIEPTLFTTYAMTFGSGLEALIISFYLAINQKNLIRENDRLMIDAKSREKMIVILKQKIRAQRIKINGLTLKTYITMGKAHFISNCLNGISCAIATNQTNNARKYLIQFGRMMRGLLQKPDEEEILVFEEISLLHAYCNMEHFRSLGKYHFRLITDNHLKMLKTMIPNLSVQPIVENAIIHGLKHLINRKPELSIEIIKEKDFLKIIVDDNGIGRVRSAEINEERRNNDENNKHESVGIDLITERIRLIVGNHDFEPLSYEDKYHKNGESLGTTATLLLPYKEYDFYHPKEGNNPFDAGFIIEADQSN